MGDGRGDYLVVTACSVVVVVVTVLRKTCDVGLS